jgi:hypothetical protein
MKTKFKLSNFLPNLKTEMQDSILQALESLTLTDADPMVKRVVGCEQKAESDPDDNKRIKILASTREIDRDNEIIFPKGMDISQFKQNPKILNGHDFSKDFLGKAISVSRNDFGIPMTIEFAPTDDGEKFRMLSKFMPLTFSIGFIPTDVITPRDAGFGDTVKKLSAEWPEFKKNRDNVTAFIRKGLLLETSIVNIPSNPGAVQLAAAKAVKDGLLEEKDAIYVVKSFGGELEPVPTKSEEPKPGTPVKAARVPQAKLYRPRVKKLYSPMTEAEQAAVIGKELKNSLALMSGKV